MVSLRFSCYGDVNFRANHIKLSPYLVVLHKNWNFSRRKKKKRKNTQGILRLVCHRQPSKKFRPEKNNSTRKWNSWLKQNNLDSFVHYDISYCCPKWASRLNFTLHTSCAYNQFLLRIPAVYTINFRIWWFINNHLYHEKKTTRILYKHFLHLA